MTRKTNEQELVKLINEGWHLHLKIKQLKTRFDEIKNLLRSEAGDRTAEHIALQTKRSHGRQWIMTGSACECRVVFPEPKLIGTVDPSSAEFAPLLKATGDHFDTLFKTVSLIAPRDKDNFKEAVRQVLPTKRAKQLLQLCTSQAEPRVGWKAKAKSRKPALAAA